MGKGQVFAPMEWVKNQFAKLNRNLTPFVLWENKGEYQDASANANIKLNTTDYVFYEVIAQYTYANPVYGYSSGKIAKGSGCFVGYSSPSDTPSFGNISTEKRIAYIDDTTLKLEATMTGYTGKARTTINQICPMYVIGYRYENIL